MKKQKQPRVKKVNQLLEQIKDLREQDKKTVLKFLRNEHVMYSKNSNGYHFNLATLSEEMITKLQQLIQTIHQNNLKVEKHEQQRLKQEEEYKKIIENMNIQKQIQTKQDNQKLLSKIEEPYQIEWVPEYTQRYIINQRTLNLSEKDYKQYFLYCNAHQKNDGKFHYAKNSVHYNILKTIKRAGKIMQSAESRKEDKEQLVIMNEGLDMDKEADVEQEIQDQLEFEQLQNNEEELQSENEAEPEVKENQEEEIDEEKEQEKEDENEEENDNDDIEAKGSDEENDTEERVNEDKDKVNSIDFLNLKDILITAGFNFDTAKDCFLKRQPYLEIKDKLN